MGCIFGPVPSRRLGRSLGVDLIPWKTCSYDCLYCQLGRTTHKTIDRKEWVFPDTVLDELTKKMATEPDFITLSGSGEPTLYAHLDTLISRIRDLTDTPIALLTNGSLLWQKTLRRQLMDLHLVVPSLDAGNEAMFNTINRPDPRLSYQQMLDGLIAMREEFQGDYQLEVFLLAGYNDTEGEINDIIDKVELIQPDRVQLNTATRPTAEKHVDKVEYDRLTDIATRFDPPAEVIADYRHVHRQGDFIAGQNHVLALLERRPCSLDDIAAGLGMHRNEAVKYIEELDAAGRISKESSGGKTYYSGRHH